MRLSVMKTTWCMYPPLRIMTYNRTATLEKLDLLGDISQAMQDFPVWTSSQQ